MENIININPFTKDFVKEEIRFMDLKPFDKDGIKLNIRMLLGRLDSYLNRDYQTGDIDAPVLTIDGTVWMSLTPMEVESNFLAWWMASGDCGTAGLGMGYVAMRMASNRNVTSVTVFEMDQRVIDAFYAMQSGRPELDKITIVQGDCRETCKGYNFDFFYSDIYPCLLDDEVIPDIALFNENNSIEHYRFWGEELILLQGIVDESINPYSAGMQVLDYFRHWESTDGSKVPVSVDDQSYVLQAIAALGDYPDQTMVELPNREDFELGEFCYG
jgi:hypothetical protein